VKRLPVAAPWDFSTPSGPGDSVPNLPSEEGALWGRDLARLADVAEARQRNAFPDQHPRCVDCAFTLGTEPNRSLPTLMDAMKCVIEKVPFYCHKGIADEGKPKRLCVGYMLLLSEADAAERKQRRERNGLKRARRARRGRS
jgi:hypothetical protein